MSESIPASLTAWGHLVDAALPLKALSPWQWLTGAPLFGVEDAASGELGFIAFSGETEFTIFRGAQGLHGLLYCRREPSPHYPERILEFPQFQVSFTRRDRLHPSDLAILRQLGQHIEGQNGWPLFRSIWPGYHPWFLEADEVTFLTCVLEQAYEVALEYRDQPEQLAPSELDYLVRMQDEAGRWISQVRHIARPLDMPVQIMMDLPLLERVRHFSQEMFSLEMDLFRVPMPPPDRGKRAPCAYLLLAVEASTGLILGHEPLNPVTTLEAMWGLVAWKTVAIFGKLGRIPRQVLVRSPLLAQMLLDMADELNFDLHQTDQLPGIDLSRAILNQMAR